MKIQITGRQSYNALFVIVVLLALIINPQAVAQPSHYWLSETIQQIKGPNSISEIPAWRAELEYYRNVEKMKLAYADLYYNAKDVQWVKTSFIQTQMMIQERSFYDPVKNEYTVDKYINDITARYGGLNSILLWPTYPNIGIDNRNEFDWIRCLPGGLNGVKKMVAQFHKHGIKVLFPYNPWDIGTRRESENDYKVYAKLLKYIDADGINGDVTTGLGAHWKKAFDEVKKGLVIEPEVDNDNKYLEYDLMGWGYWEYPFIPSISKLKWVEPKHMIQVCNRWGRDHTDDLQYAFFNGTGFVTWENIWSIYNEMTPRACETVKRISVFDQHFYKLLNGDGWEPHYPMLSYGVYASKWEGADSTLWTIVNRNNFEVSGDQIKIPSKQGVVYYDVWNGTQLKPVKDGANDVLSFSIEPNGYAAVLALDNSLVKEDLKNFLSEMSKFSATKLSDYSNVWKPVQQEIVKIEPTAKADTVPEGMVEIPAARYSMDINGIEIEGSENPGVDVQMPGEDIARRHHHFIVDISKFYMDKYPVTNEQFKKFMDATHYAPVDTMNFLKDWKKGVYPKGWDNKPVTWIDIEDARAYAKWAGKRLPHEWEWQYAAQGTDGRLYPWGNDWRTSAIPVQDTGHILRGPDDVNAHPGGKSPFGIEDMVGNVWQWTDEYVDSHTRAGILRGGSYYTPQGSFWYFPQAYKLIEHGKYLLMSAGQNRAGTLGFRCVKD
ncbi:MAG: SUMF1/EgtB/PvdO family nonheme iron enzyme [Ignavibacteriaceae bacterium]|nr:SUMF1/EgtB/PvdO family nonheme iron enzyme [Ignavibacteriaceae bacterium]